jgi:hypothetical protein
MVPVEPLPQAKIDIWKIFGLLTITIPGDDGSNGTITPRDCAKYGFGDDPDYYFANYSTYYFLIKF